MLHCSHTLYAPYDSAYDSLHPREDVEGNIIEIVVQDTVRLHWRARVLATYRQDPRLRRGWCRLDIDAVALIESDDGVRYSVQVDDDTVLLNALVNYCEAWCAYLQDDSDAHYTSWTGAQ